MSAPTFREAMQRGWNGKEWLMAVEQEEIDRENEEAEEEDDDDDFDDELGEFDGVQQQFDSAVLCMCARCVEMRQS